LLLFSSHAVMSE